MDAFVTALAGFGGSAVRFEDTGPDRLSSDVAVPATGGVPVPEPTTFLLLASGITALRMVTRQTRRMAGDER